MKLLYTLLLMGPAAAPADGAAQQPSAWPTILMFGAIILVMWLFMIRPQRKQQKEMQEFRNSLKKGDKVVTVGGIYGEIVEVNEKTVSLKDSIRARVKSWNGEGVIMILSLVLAVLIWVLTNLSKDYSGTISVPVVAQCNIDGHGMESTNTVVVSARCRTDGFRLLRERSRKERDVVVVPFDRADLRNTAPHTYCLIGSTINSYVNEFFGEGAQVEAFISDTLKFIFPAENHKRVPVEVHKSVVCRSQYMPSGPFRVTPDSVTVYGDDAHLEAVEKVVASRLLLSDVHESQHGVLRLSPIKGVRLSTEEVSFELPVSRFVELRTTVPIEVWNAPAGHEIQVYPPTAQVVMRCAFPLAKDPVAAFKLYVDWKDFNASLTGRCAARTLRLPAGVLEYRVEPEVFDCVELR